MINSTGVISLNKKVYSFLSLLILILMVSPFVLGDRYFEFIFGINILFPIILGICGVILGMIGVRGLARISLVIANFYVLGFYIIVIFLGVYGFQQP